ncbi:MAG: MerR family transcriptional regulator [Alphaproteobacteria bacterium]|nr:MerR family transcriptional regulator [Alphaproteobacteria bacterium]
MENEFFASINEVSKRLSIPAHTLRYWEKQFPVAIRPTTGTGGRRYYRAETINRLIIIKELLYRHGMTIAGVKKLLHDGKFPKSVDEINVVGSVAAGAVAPAQPAVANNAPAINAAIDLLTQARALLG